MQVQQNFISLHLRLGTHRFLGFVSLQDSEKNAERMHHRQQASLIHFTSIVWYYLLYHFIEE